MISSLVLVTSSLIVAIGFIVISKATLRGVLAPLQIEICRATCQTSLGSIAADFGGNTPQQVANTRLFGHQHNKRDKNVINGYIFRNPPHTSIQSCT